MENTFKELAELLKQHGELTTEKGVLLKNKVQELALMNDEKLIGLLLGNNKFKERFFYKVNQALIFDKDKFVGLVYNKNFLPDSYTKFSNKIALSTGDETITKLKDIVLNWPHKDCILEGGMTKENKGRDEIFWNEIIAPEHVTRIKSPKAWTNARRISAKGEQPLDDFKRDTSNNINDNLIIKGNNLLTLYSLREQFISKVKLVYIDPPYNSDSAANTFAYNNSFNHSTWLTFMKNRAEIAKDLLTDDGLFCVAIDHNELFYLGVLLDEVFNRENRLGLIAVETNRKGRSNATFFSTSHEYFLVYAKNKHLAKIRDLIKEEDAVIKEYPCKDEKSNYKRTPLKRTGSASTIDDRPKRNFPIFYDPVTKDISLEKIEGYIKMLPKGKNDIDRVWRWSKEKVLKDIDNLEVVERDGKFTIFVKDRWRVTKKPKTMWYSPTYDGSSHGTILLQKFDLEESFSYPKSLHLMKDIIRVLSDPGDLVVDFHGGSGTTAHAILDLNKEEEERRRYILVEQMEYIKTITCPRVTEVMNRNKYEEATGQSSLPWDSEVAEVMNKNKCEEDFVYLELAEWNQKWVNDIQKAKSNKGIQKLWNKLKENAFLNYRVDINKIDENAKDISELSLEDQKKFLLECLDANHLYINYSEIEDEDYGLSKEDKAINYKFYQGE